MPDLPRTIHFVAQAPVIDFVGTGNAVLAPQITPASALFHVAIFHQRCRFFRRTSSQVQAHQWLSSGRTRPSHEFIRTELIRVERVPRFVQNARPILPRANAIEPVVAGNKVASRIADDGHAHFAHLIHDVSAKTTAVGELRARIVNSFVDGAAEMLQERAEEIAVNGSDGAPGVDEDSNRSAGGRSRGLTPKRIAKKMVG